MSRIAMVATEMLPVPPIRGGAIQTLIAGVVPLLARRFDLTVVGIRHPELPDEETAGGVRWVRVPAERRVEDYAEHVVRFLGRERWDGVEIFNRPRLIGPVARALPGVPLVLSMHNDMFESNKIAPEKGRACLETLAAVVTVSDYVGRRIDELFPGFAAKITTVRSGVDLAAFRPRPDGRRGELAARLDLGEGPVVLSTSRLSRNKGTHVLIEAMRRVLDTHPQARLLLVGSAWYGRDTRNDYVMEVEEQAAALGAAVRFTGYVPYREMPRYYELGDVFVCASQWREPLARIHYEAMATGLPILTTDRGGNAEVIEEGGNGLIARPHDDPEVFADALCTLLADADLRRRLGRRGRQLAEQRYGWARTARELEAVLAAAFAAPSP